MNARPNVVKISGTSGTIGPKFRDLIFGVPNLAAMSDKCRNRATISP